MSDSFFSTTNFFYRKELWIDNGMYMLILFHFPFIFLNLSETRISSFTSRPFLYNRTTRLASKIIFFILVLIILLLNNFKTKMWLEVRTNLIGQLFYFVGSD